MTEAPYRDSSFYARQYTSTIQKLDTLRHRLRSRWLCMLRVTTKIGLLAALATIGVTTAVYGVIRLDQWLEHDSDMVELRVKLTEARRDLDKARQEIIEAQDGRFFWQHADKNDEMDLKDCREEQRRRKHTVYNGEKLTCDTSPWCDVWYDTGVFTGKVLH